MSYSDITGPFRVLLFISGSWYLLYY